MTLKQCVTYKASFWKKRAILIDSLILTQEEMFSKTDTALSTVSSAGYDSADQRGHDYALLLLPSITSTNKLQHWAINVLFDCYCSFVNSLPQ